MPNQKGPRLIYITEDDMIDDPLRMDRILNKVRKLWQANPDENLYLLLRKIAYVQNRGGTMGDAYLERLIDQAIANHNLDSPTSWERLTPISDYTVNFRR